tara:strand:- start:40 stop:501 length:462 start_codon:yes stop_codon:yes gene_type:complete
MAHYSFINIENIVVEVITGKDEDDLETLPEGFASWEEYYETKRDGLTCKRTSYNTSMNEHHDGGTAFRGNYAGIGYSYNAELDVFLAPKPFEDWILNETTMNWEAPVPFPSDANYDRDTSLPVKHYEWNEMSQSWVVIVTENYNSETEEWEVV